jgi:hypothetical protein
VKRYFEDELSYNHPKGWYLSRSFSVKLKKHRENGNKEQTQNEDGDRIG